MYCSNCGKQLEDGVRFCRYCGAPTSRSETSTRGTENKFVINQENRTVREEPAMGTVSSKNKGRRGTIISAVLIALVAIIAGAFLVRSMSGSDEPAAVVNSGDTDDEEAAKSNTTGNSYAIPELPDILLIEGVDNNNYILGWQELVAIPDYCNSIQLAENGTFAIQSAVGGSVLIYRNGAQISEIPGYVQYFCLSGNGEKIVYGTSYDNSYLWDIATGESSLISDTYSTDEISYDGSTLGMWEHYSRNGKTPRWVQFPYILDISPDGNYIYYAKRSAFGVMINGTEHGLLSYTNDDSFPQIIACSRDYKEVLFRFNNDIYYFSVENAMDIGFEAQYVGNIGEGILLNLSKLITYDTSFSLFNGEAVDTISCWIDYWSESAVYSSNQYRNQKLINKGVFCLLKEQNGVRSASIVRLVDNQLVELIPNITGNICVSADETKLWCVADGRLAFCDLSENMPHAVYCDTAYVRAYDDVSAYAVTSGTPDSSTCPIAATSDGERACFIDVDGLLWMCTPDTVYNPKYVADNAYWVQCSAENEFYLMKGNFFESDLYLIDTNGVATYQYGNVADAYMTKSDVYIAVGRRVDDSYLTTFDIYRKDGDSFKLVYEGPAQYYYGLNTIGVGRWGSQY